MIAYTGVSVINYQKAKMFYTKVLATVEYKQNMEFGEAAGFMEDENMSFWIVQKKKVTSHHVAFGAKNKKQGESFYRMAMKNSGQDNDRPGYRLDYWPKYYTAFALDANGNDNEAVWFDSSKMKKEKKGKKKG